MRAGFLAVVLPLVRADALTAGSPSAGNAMHRSFGNVRASGPQRPPVGSIEPWQADRLPLVREDAPITR
jgi:hypothetical protein